MPDLFRRSRSWKPLKKLRQLKKGGGGKATASTGVASKSDCSSVDGVSRGTATDTISLATHHTEIFSDLTCLMYEDECVETALIDSLDKDQASRSVIAFSDVEHPPPNEIFAQGTELDLTDQAELNANEEKDAVGFFVNDSFRMDHASRRVPNVPRESVAADKGIDLSNQGTMVSIEEDNGVEASLKNLLHAGQASHKGTTLATEIEDASQQSKEVSHQLQVNTIEENDCVETPLSGPCDKDQSALVVTDEAGASSTEEMDAEAEEVDLATPREPNAIEEEVVEAPLDKIKAFQGAANLTEEGNEVTYNDETRTIIVGDGVETSFNESLDIVKAPEGALALAGKSCPKEKEVDTSHQHETRAVIENDTIETPLNNSVDKDQASETAVALGEKTAPNEIMAQQQEANRQPEVIVIEDKESIYEAPQTQSPLFPQAQSFFEAIFDPKPDPPDPALSKPKPKENSTKKEANQKGDGNDTDKVLNSDEDGLSTDDHATGTLLQIVELDVASNVKGSQAEGSTPYGSELEDIVVISEAGDSQSRGFLIPPVVEWDGTKHLKSELEGSQKEELTPESSVSNGIINPPCIRKRATAKRSVPETPTSINDEGAEKPDASKSSKMSTEYPEDERANCNEQMISGNLHSSKGSSNTEPSYEEPMTSEKVPVVQEIIEGTEAEAKRQSALDVDKETASLSQSSPKEEDQVAAEQDLEREEDDSPKDETFPTKEEDAEDSPTLRSDSSASDILKDLEAVSRASEKQRGRLVRGRSHTSADGIEIATSKSLAMAKSKAYVPELDDYNSLLDRSETNRSVQTGLSDLTAAAKELAQRYPDLVKKLLACGPADDEIGSLRFRDIVDEIEIIGSELHSVVTGTPMMDDDEDDDDDDDTDDTDGMDLAKTFSSCSDVSYSYERRSDRKDPIAVRMDEYVDQLLGIGKCTKEETPRGLGTSVPWTRTCTSPW